MSDSVDFLANEPTVTITMHLYERHGVCCFSRIERAAEEKGETWDEYILNAVADRLKRDKMV